MTYERLKVYSYTLDELITVFSEHAPKAEKTHQELISAFKKNYPDEPLPDHFKDDFNLSRALLTFAIEINELKEELTSLSDSYYGYDQ